jgi:hypothetical protein
MINWLAVDYGEDQTLLEHEVALEAHDASAGMSAACSAQRRTVFDHALNRDKAEVSFFRR